MRRTADLVGAVREPPCDDMNVDRTPNRPNGFCVVGLVGAGLQPALSWFLFITSYQGGSRTAPTTVITNQDNSMQMIGHNNPPPKIDTGLDCLIIMARLHRKRNFRCKFIRFTQSVNLR